MSDGLILSRRRILACLSGLAVSVIAAPAIVRASSLMGSGSIPWWRAVSHEALYLDFQRKFLAEMRSRRRDDASWIESVSSFASSWAATGTEILPDLPGDDIYSRYERHRVEDAEKDVVLRKMGV